MSHARKQRVAPKETRDASRNRALAKAFTACNGSERGERAFETRLVDDSHSAKLKPLSGPTSPLDRREFCGSDREMQMRMQTTRNEITLRGRKKDITQDP